MKRRTDLEDESLSAIWLEVKLGRQRSIIVGNAYREWGHSGDPLTRTIPAQLARWQLFLSKWELALSENKEVVVLMDANIDYMKWNRPDLPPNDNSRKLQPLVDELFSRILPLGVSQVVQGPTRIGPNGKGGQVASGLDHIYTNQPFKLTGIQAEYSGISDHKIIRASRHASELKMGPRYVKKRQFKDFDSEVYKNTIKTADWSQVMSAEDVDDAVTNFTRIITAALDQLAPVKKIQTRKKYAPFLSEETKEEMVSRDKAQQRAAESGKPEDWTAYRRIRNKVTASLKKDKRKWEANQLNHKIHDPTALWRNMKQWLNWAKGGPPAQLCSPETRNMLITSPTKIAETMNDFFVDKVSKLRQGIPVCIEDPLATMTKMMQTRTCSMTLRPVSEEEIYKIIKKLKSSRTAGSDWIDATSLKLVAEEISAPLTYIINLSIKQGKFPTQWKLSKIIPLLKKESPLLPKNYRPVAILSTCSKVLERAVFNQLIQYLEENSLLHENHHGCRKAHNTTTAIIQLYDQWTSEVDAGQITSGLLIDLSAAFDMVDPALLGDKMRLMGITEQTLEWFGNYMKGRRQAVTCEGSVSTVREMECGVPQGSILGPLLYVVFTSDIPELGMTNQHSTDSNIAYVDDTTHTSARKSPGDLSNHLTEQFNHFKTYMDSNKLVINNDKTHLIVFGGKNRNQEKDQVTLRADIHLIKRSNEERLLGAQISDDLKWKVHLSTGEKSLIKSLIGRVNALAKLGINATNQTRLLAANGVFMSSLSYLIPAWGGTESYLLDSLQILQNRAARIVTRRNIYTTLTELLQICDWLSVRQLVVYHTVSLTRKIIKTGKPVYLAKRLSSDFLRQTRQSTMGNLKAAPMPNRQLTERGFLYRAPQTFNQIPAEIRSLQSDYIFKKKLKIWVSQNIPIH